jgi:F-type H+-transporting ATPase subunit b
MPRPLRIRLGTLVETTEMPTLRPYFTAAGLCFLPGIALAAGGGGDVAHTLEDSLVPMAFHALNLLLLLGGLGYLLKGRITTALATRADTIAHAIQGAGAAEAEAEARFAELSEKMDGFEAALAQMRAEAERLADADRADLIARAQREAAAIKDGAQRSIRDEQARATTAIRAEAAKLAVGLAARQVAENINEDDHTRLDGEFLEALQGEEANHG